jgi:hypothetical membrane protein
METLKRCLSGRHTPLEIRVHLAALAIVYWGLVFCAWLGLPERQNYSIMTHMLSLLGSFDDRHNPQWFWVFSVAMVYCGAAMVPIMLFIRRRFVAVSHWGAQVGVFFFLLGCAAIALTGLFPFGRGNAFGHWQWRVLHVNAAASIAVGFSIGILWHGALLLKDKFTTRALASRGRFPYLKFVGPYLVCAPVFGIAGYRIHWKSIYEVIIASAHAPGGDTTHVWNRAMSGLGGFALLEHMAIWALTIYVIWFTVALSREPDATAP